MLALLTCGWLAFAVVDGHDASHGLTPEDRLMREVTVRLVQVLATGEKQICSGVQIGRRAVLSAGHCLSSGVQDAMDRGTLWIDAFDPDRPARRRRTRVTAMEGGDVPAVDFAILRTRDDLPARRSVPFAYYGCDENSSYLLAGYGVTGEGEGSRRLRVARGRPADADEDARIKRLHDPSSRRLTVAAVGDARVCNGDSGGPIFCRKGGRIALAGVLNENVGRPGKQSIGEDSPKANYCRDWTGLATFTTVGHGMDLIEKFRGGDAPAKTADGPEKVTPARR